MSESLSLEQVTDYIKSLSPEDEALLFNLLHSRWLEKQSQEKLQLGNATCEIRVGEASKSWGDEDKATYHVLLENQPGGGAIATLLGWPDCKAFAATRQQALLRLQELVNARLAKAEIVPVQIKSTQSDNSWSELAGHLKNNPLFEEVLGYMEAYRRELDEETEAYYRQLEEKEASK